MTPAMAPWNENEAVNFASTVLASKLIQSVDPTAIDALEYTAQRPELEPRSPIVGIGVTNTEKELKLAVLSRVPGDRFNFPKVLHHLELPHLPFEVFEVGDISAAASPAVSTVQGGDSIQMQGGPAGTLACAVVENATGTPLLLTCNHVIAGCNNGTRGTTPVMCPANSGNQIGVLYDFETIGFGNGLANSMDAALCKPPPGSYAAGLRSKGSIAGLLQSPALNTNVEKEGAATGITKGVLTIKKATLLVNLSAGAAVFDNQYAVTGVPSTLAKLGITSGAFAAGGDSGALVTDLNNAAVGILVAVSSMLNQAYVSPIDPILTRFGIKII